MTELTEQARRDLVAQYASKYNLDAAFVYDLMAHMSRWNPWMYRHDVDYQERVISAFRLPLEETVMRATRWGVGQVYGQAAREAGMTGYLTQLCDVETGLDYACRLLASCVAQTPTKDAAFEMYYRGKGGQ